MKKETRGIKAYIDIFDALGYQPIHGVPLGGIGAGTITRGNAFGDVINTAADTEWRILIAEYAWHKELQVANWRSKTLNDIKKKFNSSSYIISQVF